MKNVLITGASGFIGSFLVEEGIQRNYSVYAAIRKSSSRQYLTDPGIHLVEMDFSTKESVLKTLTTFLNQGIRFDYIIHNAGLTKANRKEDYYNVNCRNTINFIDAIRESGTNPEKFIFISSLAAYGPGHPVTMKPVLLTDEPRPIEIYGKSKLEAENYIRSLTDFPWVIMRPTGVYGPREKDYYVFFKTINRGLETYIGRETQILTFIYVRDLVRVVFDALESSHVRKSYFVADGKEYTTKEFAAITKNYLKKKTVRITVPKGTVKVLASILESLYSLWNAMPTLNSDKYSVLSAKNWRCETDPLQQDLQFRARYDLEKGVAETIAWYREHGWLK